MVNKTDREILRTLSRVEQLTLKDIRLVEVNGKVGDLKSNSLPTEANHEMRIARHVDSKQGLVHVVANYRLTVAYGDSDTGKEPIVIMAKFGLSYGCKPGTKEKDCGDLAEQLAAVNSWPYWRELAQSLTVRMGLPAMQLPLLNVRQVVEKLRKPERTKPKARLAD